MLQITTFRKSRIAAFFTSDHHTLTVLNLQKPYFIQMELLYLFIAGSAKTFDIAARHTGSDPINAPTGLLTLRYCSWLRKIATRLPRNFQPKKPASITR